MKKYFVLIAMFVSLFLGCQRQAQRVSYNVSKAADNFNVERRFTAINMRTDKIMFEMTGVFSFEVESGTRTNSVVILVKTGPDEYRKHTVNLNEWTAYVVEDTGGYKANSYRYEMNFYPEMLIPITTSNY